MLDDRKEPVRMVGGRFRRFRVANNQLPGQFQQRRCNTVHADFTDTASDGVKCVRCPAEAVLPTMNLIATAVFTFTLSCGGADHRHLRAGTVREINSVATNGRHSYLQRSRDTIDRMYYFHFVFPL